MLTIHATKKLLDRGQPDPLPLISRAVGVA
jgi:hypothetical protein